MRKPILLFDGDCTFCKFWVARWQNRVGDRVRFAPYQMEGKRYPEITQEAFETSIQFLLPDGSRYHGAEGVFRVLAFAEQGVNWLWMYEHVPGFRVISEWGYTWIASCRVCAWKLTKLLFPSAKTYERTCE